MNYNNHRSNDFRCNANQLPCGQNGNYGLNVNCGPNVCCGPNANCNPTPCFGGSCAPPTPFCGPCEAKPLVYPFGPRRAVTLWKINSLVSNHINWAAHVDLDLINPWGIVIYNNQLFVACGSTDNITNYDLFGNKILATVSVRNSAHNSSFPTGIAINCGGGFTTSNGTISKSGLLLTATEHGTVHSYNPSIDAATLYSPIVLNQQLTGEVSVFRGLAIANNILYLANFFQGVIDVFDSNYNRLLGFHFIDGDSVDPIPLDYGPTNIVHIGCFMYVLYARKDNNVTVQDLDGPGHGFISVFNLDGSWVKRFTSRGVLNSPWAMIPAPCECGFPPGSFLVGNNGDGRINVFDCAGRYVGPMLSQTGLPLYIEGLWGLAPLYTDFSEIFFASAPDENVDGLIGSITKETVIYF